MVDKLTASPYFTFRDRKVKPGGQAGEFHERNHFIPTTWSGPSGRTKSPRNLDREPIQTFVDAASSLVKDDVRRAEGGLKYCTGCRPGEDLKCARPPDWASSRPFLTDKELAVRFELFTRFVRPRTAS